MAATPTGAGYWLVAADGGVFAFGDAGFYGSMGGAHLNEPIVGLSATRDGHGYWLVAADGGVFAFGDAGFYGSMGGTYLNEPIVGLAATRDGHGYWLVAADGGIFTFGDARFYGSMGGTPLNQPVVAVAADPVTGGYWMAAADGGVFSFHAPFRGAAHPNAPVVGIAATANGQGYWLATADGGVYTFGAARFYGSMGGRAITNPITAIATDRAANGYWLLPTSLPPGVPPLPLLSIPSEFGSPGYSIRFPKTIDFSADAGNIVSAISWSAWGPQEAVGHGTWTYQDCVPSCAQGSETPYPATITLSQVVNGNYTQLEEATTGPHGFTIEGHFGTPDWPLGASH